MSETVQTKPEEILDRIRDIIITYNRKRSQITDAALEDYRAKLSVGTYIMVETVIQPAYDDMILTEIEQERTEGTVYMEYFEEFRKTRGDSAADTLARKSSKMDERYLQAMEKHGKAKQYAYLLNRLLDQANQVLNSMAKKAKIS